MYYPKFEITPNLYTDGTKFILGSTGKFYKGSYYSTTDGKFFTGSDYSPNAEELFPPKSNNIISNSITPNHYTSIPNDTDYKNGFFIRYAIKRVNSGFETIKEIQSDDFAKIQSNPLYTSVSFKWKITGPLYDDLSNKNHPIYGIIDTNKRTLTPLEKKIPGISKFFFDLAQFSQ